MVKIILKCIQTTIDLLKNYQQVWNNHHIIKKV